MADEQHEVKYRTRIQEHIRLASAKRLQAGKGAVTRREISRELDLPYQTLRWYINASIGNPNFATIEAVRRYLNQFHEMPQNGYIYREGEDLPKGQLAGIATS